MIFCSPRGGSREIKPSHAPQHFKTKTKTQKVWGWHHAKWRYDKSREDKCLLLSLRFVPTTLSSAPCQEGWGKWHVIPGTDTSPTQNGLVRCRALCHLHILIYWPRGLRRPFTIGETRAACAFWCSSSSSGLFSVTRMSTEITCLRTGDRHVESLFMSLTD